ncbi:hypothetical protein COL940_012977 [Colletotrichum noveboracense]|nr:hypothetical protein COL940_012977 [Colletotrichum noveboracense]KAJ0291486.1 hypothetical protein CBS470a_003484 [Colletotrichum nupharicola]
MAPNFDAMTLVQIRQFLRDSSIRISARARRADLLQIAKAYGFTSDDVPKDEGVRLAMTSSGQPKASIKKGNTKPAKTSGGMTFDDPLRNIPIQSDDISYVQVNFSPTSLTIAKLRNILAAHEVSYATAKTKKDFIQLFLSNIKPRAAAIIKAMAAVKRTDAGIIDMRP